MLDDLDSLPDLKKITDKEARHACYAAYIARGQLFGVEADPSGRAKCKGCSKNIAKESLRLRHLVCNANRCCKGGGLDVCGRWHIGCFLETQAKDLNKFLWTNEQNQDCLPVTTTSQLAGFPRLTPQQQHEVQQAFVKK